jgi:hypothetical protein
VFAEGEIAVEYHTQVPNRWGYLDNRVPKGKSIKRVKFLQLRWHPQQKKLSLVRVEEKFVVSHSRLHRRE